MVLASYVLHVQRLEEVLKIYAYALARILTFLRSHKTLVLNFTKKLFSMKSFDSASEKSRTRKAPADHL